MVQAGRLPCFSISFRPPSSFAVWALLYLPHLRTSPAWYGDEGLAFTVGINLIRGTPAHGSYWTTQSIPEVEAAADWINSKTTPADLVLCHQNIASLLHARTADHLQSTSWLGHETWPFKTPLPRDQFRFAPDPAQARFIVIAEIDKRWTLSQPNVSKLLERLEKENWPVVWSGDHYVVLKNPDSREFR